MKIIAVCTDELGRICGLQMFYIDEDRWFVLNCSKKSPLFTQDWLDVYVQYCYCIIFTSLHSEWNTTSNWYFIGDRIRRLQNMMRARKTYTSGKAGYDKQYGVWNTDKKYKITNLSKYSDHFKLNHLGIKYTCNDIVIFWKFCYIRTCVSEFEKNQTW